jgi:hypothetical protein
MNLNLIYSLNVVLSLIALGVFIAKGNYPAATFACTAAMAWIILVHKEDEDEYRETK